MVHLILSSPQVQGGGRKLGKIWNSFLDRCDHVVQFLFGKTRVLVAGKFGGKSGKKWEMGARVVGVIKRGHDKRIVVFFALVATAMKSGSG